ncbi:hypothetical protein RDV64_00390 [Acuticoccus sp. MNP-M23]|uniref:hypothetical protein n=1 Tax=Acuticoccus sp. MNP-M23 TaxID=3072793 RepID=UPI002814FE3F|nr:hypothetical protein [Acuticoccus sp. MNP-M23]WMS42896.1 hypothetical protein RDV64_00390 [Acuticoccus sp. MNP-M23]
MRNLLIAAAGLAAALVAGTAAIAAVPAATAAEDNYQPTRIDRYDASGMPLESAPVTPRVSASLDTRLRGRTAAAGERQQLAYSQPRRHRRHSRRYRPPHRPYYRPRRYRPHRPYYRPPPVAYRRPYYAPPPVYRRGPRCVTRVVRVTPRGRVVRIVPGCGPRGRRHWRRY